MVRRPGHRHGLAAEALSTGEPQEERCRGLLVLTGGYRWWDRGG